MPKQIYAVTCVVYDDGTMDMNHTLERAVGWHNTKAAQQKVIDEMQRITNEGAKCPFFPGEQHG